MIKQHSAWQKRGLDLWTLIHCCVWFSFLFLIIWFFFFFFQKGLCYQSTNALLALKGFRWFHFILVVGLWFQKKKKKRKKSKPAPAGENGNERYFRVNDSLPRVIMPPCQSCIRWPLQLPLIVCWKAWTWVRIRRELGGGRSFVHLWLLCWLFWVFFLIMLSFFAFVSFIFFINFS